MKRNAACVYWLIILTFMSSMATAKENPLTASQVMRQEMKSTVQSQIDHAEGELPQAAMRVFTSYLNDHALIADDIAAAEGFLSDYLADEPGAEETDVLASMLASILKLEGVDTDMPLAVMRHTGTQPWAVTIMMNDLEVNWSAYAGDWSESVLEFMTNNMALKSYLAHGLNPPSCFARERPSLLPVLLVDLLVDFSHRADVRDFLVSYPFETHGWVMTTLRSGVPNESLILSLRPNSTEAEIRRADEHGRDALTWYYEEVAVPAGVGDELIEAAQARKAMLEAATQGWPAADAAP